MAKTLWLMGRSGVGKTFHAGPIAARRGWSFCQLDHLRPRAWEELRGDGTLGAQTDGCADYVEARTRSLGSAATFIELHEALGRKMLGLLEEQLQDAEDNIVLIECSACYMRLIPPGVPCVRLVVSSKIHRRNIMKALRISPREAQILGEFLEGIEQRLLPEAPMFIESSPLMLEKALSAMAGRMKC